MFATPTLRDALAAVPAQDAVRTAIAAIDGIQAQPRAEQIVGVFVLARAMAEQLGLDVSDLMNQADRRLRHANNFAQREAQALLDFVNGELRR